MTAPSVEELARGVLAGDRVLLARAITLIESRSEADRSRALELLTHLRPAAGGALRVGVSGPPGVGKSTLIDALGVRLVERGRRVRAPAQAKMVTCRAESVRSRRSSG